MYNISGTGQFYDDFFRPLFFIEQRKWVEICTLYSLVISSFEIARYLSKSINQNKDKPNQSPLPVKDRLNMPIQVVKVNKINQKVQKLNAEMQQLIRASNPIGLAVLSACEHSMA
ncbi:hypothetical protein [Chryseobacterium flavum]|uniref:hypothetical protein n=1 Tax=Chryseobacterium flavum TaxID=415851 RepID=UPI0028ABE2B2|nr:hypothetical protein [Chryseobacterium flavum]